MVKKGYSLVEALLAMMVVSVLFALMSNVITSKPKPITKNEAHGYFECYKNTPGDSKVIQRLVYEKKEIENIVINGYHCNFIPPKGTQSFAAWTNVPYKDGETVILPSIKSNSINIQLTYPCSSYYFDNDLLPVMNNNEISLNDLNNHYSMMRFLYKNTKIFEENNEKCGILIGW